MKENQIIVNKDMLFGMLIGASLRDKPFTDKEVKELIKELQKEVTE